MSDTFIHSTSVVEEGAYIGKNTKVWLFCHIMHDAKIGDNCQLGQNVYVGKKVTIGNGVKVQNNVSVYEDVTLEDDVFCGPSVVFTNVINPRSFISRKEEFKKTLVKKGATLGANSTIVCGITVGEYSFVGAGATVTKNVKPYAVMVGVPAKQTGWVCECAIKLIKKNSIWQCPECQKKYQENSEGELNVI